MGNALNNRRPKFRVDKESSPPKVFLQCSNCDVDIQELKPQESIRVDRAYYCDDCDPGVIALNPSHDKSEKGNG